MNNDIESLFGNDPLNEMIFHLHMAAWESERFLQERESHLKSTLTLPRHQRPLDYSYWASRTPNPCLGRTDIAEVNKLITYYREIVEKTKDHISLDQRYLMLGSTKSQIEYYYKKYFPRSAYGKNK